MPNQNSNLVTLLDPDDNQVQGPASEVQAALAVPGYRLATPENLAEVAAKAKYGSGIGNAAKAFGAGVLRGGTLNLSDPVLTHLGVAPETLAGLEKYNPGSSLAGQAVGTLGALAVAPEAEVGEGAVAAKNALTAADAVNPVSAVSKLGGKVAEGLGGLVPEAGSGVASKILSGTGQVAARGLGSAVEGAFYGAGQTLSEKALGDPDVTAERLMANVGYGALLGGGLGSTVEAGRLAVPKSVDAAKGIIGDAYTKMMGAVPEEGDEFAAGPGLKAYAKLAGAANGEPEQAIIDRYAQRFEKNPNAVEMTPEARAQHIEDFGDAGQGIYDAVTKASLDSKKLARPQETAALLKDIEPEAPRQELNKFISRDHIPPELTADLAATSGVDPAALAAERTKPGIFDSAINEMNEKPRLYPARFVNAMEEIRKGVAEVGQDASPAKIFKALDDAKRELDTKIEWNKEFSGESADAKRLFSSVRSDLRSSLENQDIWGQAAARQAASNEAFTAFQNAKKMFQKRFMEKTAPYTYEMKPSKVNTFFNQINDYRGRPQQEAYKEFVAASRAHLDDIAETYKNAPFENFDKDSIESLLSKHAETAENAHNIIQKQPGGFGKVSDFMGAALALKLGGPLGLLAKFGVSAAKDTPENFIQRLANIEKAAQKTSRVIDSATKMIVNGTASTAQKIKGPIIQSLDAHNERAEKINSMHSNPMHMIDHMTAATRPVSDIAPNTGNGVNAIAARATEFLSSKLPQSQNMGAFAKPQPPSDVELAKFHRYYQVANKPLSILEDMRDGTMTNEGLEALTTIYPKLYSEMQQKLLTNLASVKDKSKIPYSTKLSISQFMGQPLDPSTNPMNMATIYQVSSAAHQEQAAPTPHPTAKGLGHLTLANRAMTTFQQSASREK